MLTNPLTASESARLQAVNLSRYFIQNRQYLVNIMRTHVKGFKRAIMARFSTGGGGASAYVSHDELVEEVRFVLNNAADWQSLLISKPHVPFGEWDSLTDAMARHIVDEAFSEITR